METIKQVTIKSASAYGPVDYAYEDKLTLTSHGVSYELTPVIKDGHYKKCKWKYETTSAFFSRLFQKIAVAVNTHIIENNVSMNYIDAGVLEFIVVFSDKSKFERCITFYDVDFTSLLLLIDKAVPSIEENRPVILENLFCENSEED